MTPRRRTFLIVSIVVIGLVAVIYAASGSIILNGYATLETQDACRDVARAQEALAHELVNLDSRAADWANWDDTYGFIEDANSAYVAANLTDKALSDLHINLMVFVNMAGQVVASKGTDLLTASTAVVPPELLARLGPGDRLLQPALTGKSQSGFVLLPPAPMLIVARPILHNEGLGPVRGTLIFGRYLDEGEIASLAQTTDLHLALRRLDAPLPADFQAVYGAPWSTADIRTQLTDPNTIAAYGQLTDIDKRPIALLRVDSPRTIYQQGLISLNFFRTALAGVSLGFGVVIAGLLRRLMRQAQSESEAKYRAIIEQTSEGILLVEPGSPHVLESNAAAQSLLGYTADELRQKTLTELTGSAQAIDPLPLPVGSPRLALPAEATYRRKDGSTVLVDVNLNTVTYGGIQQLCVSLRDITERKQAEQLIQTQTNQLQAQNQELQQQTDVLLTQSRTLAQAEADLRRLNTELEARVAARTAELQAEVAQHRQTELALDHERRLLRTVIDNVPDQIFARDRDCRFTLSNRADAAVMGVSDPETLVGKTDHDFYPPALAARYQADDRRVMETGLSQIDQEEPSLGEDGAERWALTTKVPLHDSQGQITGLVGIARDITRRKEAENALNALNAQLTRALHSRDEFLASMSHELRTPLTGILGLSEALQMNIYGPVTNGQSEALQGIHTSGEHLLALITDILDLAKAGAGKLDLQITPVSVAHVCQASLQLVQGQAAQKQIKLTLKLDQAMTLINADERRLKQILVNLLGNAIKFTPKGGEVGLEVKSDVEQSLAHFVVWDTGIGIAPEVMPRLFKPFVQLDNRLNREHAGTGLGLALTHELVQQHDGRIALESAGVPGLGSRFTVSLPWQARPWAQEKESWPSPIAFSDIGTTNPKSAIPGVQLIVADDNPTTLAVLRDALAGQGYQVTAASDGADALAQARVIRPALMVLDIQMPGIDGLEVIRQVRSDPALATTPIIALTALTMPGDRERCLQAGASDYLSKPVNLNRLFEIVKRHLEQTVPAPENQPLA
jgi:PAS domain S-box-containing protein